MNCHKCNKEIIKQEEKYITVENYEFGKSIRKVWFHLICWNESINLNIQVKNLLDKLKPMVKQITGQ